MRSRASGGWWSSAADNLCRVIFLQCAEDTPRTACGAAARRRDPESDLRAVRHRVSEDIVTTTWTRCCGRSPAHRPDRGRHRPAPAAACRGLSTGRGRRTRPSNRRHPQVSDGPLALPTREYMGIAALGGARPLPLAVQSPWHGYSLVDWTDAGRPSAARRGGDSSSRARDAAVQRAGLMQERGRLDEKPKEPPE